MSRYLARRSINLILTLLVVSFLVFGLIRILPGDPAYLLAAVDEGSYIDPQVYQAVRDKFGLDRPIVVQYGNWLWGVLHGDWGISFFSRKEVFPQIVSRLSFTAQLAVLSWVFSLLMGVSLGVVSALKRNTLPDVAATILAIAGVASPNFLLGLMFIILFGVWLGWLPIGGYQSLLESPTGWFRHMVLPTVMLGTGLAAIIMRQTRSALLEVLGEDYIRTARAKGLVERRVIWPHALKNAMLPVVTVSSLQLGALIGGTVITESVFALPGLGRFVVDAVIQQDYLVVQMGMLVMALGVLLANFAADILYTYLDPRIRYG